MPRLLQQDATVHQTPMQLTAHRWGRTNSRLLVLSYLLVQAPLFLGMLSNLNLRAVLSGCKSTARTMIAAINLVAAARTNANSAVIALYPNPTSDFVTLELPAEDGAIAYVFDAQGKLIYEVENAKNGQHFDLSRLSTGVYTFRITLNNLSHIEKVVKQ